MKRFAILALALLLCACAPTSPPAELTAEMTVPSETARDICADYIEHLTAHHGFTPARDEVAVQREIGVYSGRRVVYMSGPLNVTTAHRPVEVAGYTIVFLDGQPLYVYADGDFLTLSEAYAAGEITAEDVREIGTAVGLEFAAHNSPHPNDDPTVYRYTAYLLRRDYAAQVGLTVEAVWVSRLYPETYADQTALLVEMGRPDGTKPEAFLVTVQDVHQFHTIAEAEDILTPDEYAAVLTRLGKSIP